MTGRDRAWVLVSLPTACLMTACLIQSPRGPGAASAARSRAASSGGVADAPRAPVGASGLPIPARAGVPRPSGRPGDLTVLDWAGFKAAVSWTFDDAQPSHIEHYAALQAVGVPVTFYVSPGNSTGDDYDRAWARAARDGHEIGNHSVHHCHADLTGCTFGAPERTLAAELDTCSAYIVARYPQPAVWTAASPFGDTGYGAVAASRFLVNRGVRGGSIGARDHTDPFDLPVHAAIAGETSAQLNAITDGAHAGGRWVVFVIHTVTPTDAVWYAPVAIDDVTAGMRHGRSMPDVWTDTVVNVAAYWRAQKLLAGVTPARSADGATTWAWTLPPHFPPGKYLRVTVAGGTLSQGGRPLPWDEHGYYEVALDAGALTSSP